MHKSIVLYFIAACTFFCSCTSVRIISQAAQPAKSIADTVKLRRWFMGIAWHGEFQDTLKHSQGFQSVEVRTTFGQGLVTVITLGIYAPVEIIYKRAKKCPPPIPD